MLALLLSLQYEHTCPVMVVEYISNEKHFSPKNWTANFLFFLVGGFTVFKPTNSNCTKDMLMRLKVDVQLKPERKYLCMQFCGHHLLQINV